MEGISALLDLMPRHPGEDNSALARRLADWGLEQGPDVRWAAIVFSALSTIKAQGRGVRYPQLASIGWTRWRSTIGRFAARPVPSRLSRMMNSCCIGKW